jgi:hypothetical protein
MADFARMVRVCDCREKEKELIKKKLQASKAHKDKVKQVRRCLCSCATALPSA